MTILRRGELVEHDGILHRHSATGIGAIGISDYRRRWEDEAANPVTLGAADLDAMLGSGMLFARKFDAAADSDVLDLLDETAAPVTIDA